MPTLYRKYRPQNFIEVVGQNHIKVILQNEIQTGQIAQAYIFCGPRGVGKTTVARVLAKTINCLERKEDGNEPCNKCDLCSEITLGRSLDIIEIDAASHTGVNNVRENIIASARTSPSRCKYKVFIIDEVHMLSISAFNALLKIIEEPPAYVIFILCTTEIHKVPTTIISRCQRFDFKRISVNDVTKKLHYIIKEEKIKIDKNILESIARKSEGYMRDAESLLGQIISIGGNNITQEEADLVIPRSDINEIINLIGSLTKKDCANGIRLINKLIDDGVNLKTFIDDLIEVLRKIMLGKINPGLTEKLGLEFGETLEIKINEISKDLTLEQLINLLEKFIKVRNDIKDSFIAQLPLELAIAELCMVRETYSKVEPAKVQKNNPSSPAKQTASSQISGNINIDKIISKWPEVLAKIKKYNHSLSFILRVCQPKDLKGNQLCLAFKYKFHKDRMNDMQIKVLIERILNEVYDQPLIIEAIIDESIPAQDLSSPVPQKKEAGQDSDMMNNLLKTFGGKIVK